MKNFLLSIFCCLMAFVSVQAEEVSGTITFKTSGSDSSTAANTGNFVTGQVTANGGFTLSCTATNNCYTGKSGLKMSSSKASGSFTLGLGDTYNVKKVIVNAVKYSNDAAAVAVNGATAQSLSSTATDYTFDVNSEINQIKVDMTKRGYIASITIVYEVAGGAGGETPEQPETPVAPAAPTLTASCYFDNSMNVEITNIAEGATAYYSLNSEANWVAGTSVTITETTTVYAKVVKDGLSSIVVSAIYTKNEPVTPPAEGEVVDVLNREFTGVSGTSYAGWSGKKATSSAVYAGQSAGGNSSIQLRSDNNNSGIVTTKSGGKVKKVVVEWNSNTSVGRTLNVYGKNSAYTAATDLYNNSNQGTLLGTIVKGTSTVLEIDGDYEYIGLRSDSKAMYLTSVSITWDASAGVTPVAPNAPKLTESKTFKGSMTVTITSDATVYYTTDGTAPSATNGTEYTAPFEITATTTVKAVAVNEVGASEFAEATYTLFVVEETVGYYVKVTSEPADWTGKYLIVYEEESEEGNNAYVFNGKDEVNGYVAATNNNGVINANSELDGVVVEIAEMEGGYFIMAKAGYMAGESGSNGLVFASDAALNTLGWAADGVVITSNGRVLRFNSASNQMRFRYYGDGQKPVQLYKYYEELPSYTLTVTEAGYATLYLGFATEIPSAVKAYVVSSIEDGYAKLTQVEGVLPANTGVVIAGENGEAATAGTYKFNYAAPVNAIEGNKLAGSTIDTYIAGPAYVLGYINVAEEGQEERKEVGFYKAALNLGAGGTTGTTHFKNNANKAYLPMPADASGISFYGFRFDEEENTTGIEVVENANENVIYDLAGRRVSEITAPGIYIIDGKKVLVK